MITCSVCHNQWAWLHLWKSWKCGIQGRTDHFKIGLVRSFHCRWVTNTSMHQNGRPEITLCKPSCPNSGLYLSIVWVVLALSIYLQVISLLPTELMTWTLYNPNSSSTFSNMIFWENVKKLASSHVLSHWLQHFSGQTFSQILHNTLFLAIVNTFLS